MQPDLWWREQKHKARLMNHDYALGEVAFVVTAWQAKPFWYEQSQLFETEEEARAWLATVARFEYSN